MPKHQNINNHITELYEEKYNSTEIRIISGGIELYQSSFLNNQSLSKNEINELATKADDFFSKHKNNLKEYAIEKRKEFISSYLTGDLFETEISSPPENVIKDFCKEMEMTYEDLSEILGYSISAIKKSASQNSPTRQMQKSIELYRENIILKRKLEEFAKIQDILHQFVNKHIP